MKFILIFALMFVVYFFLIKVIAKGRIHLSSTKKISNNKEILKNSYNISDIQKGKDSDVNMNKVHKFTKALERNEKKQNGFLDNIFFKVTYVSPQKTMRDIMIGYAVFMIVTSVILVLVTSGKNLYLMLGIGICAGFFLQNIVINYKYNKKIKAFLDNFMYALDMISRGVRSGLMLNDCFHLIAQESDPVVAEQFKYMLQDTQVGMTVEQVMDRFAKRLPIKEVKFFTLVLSVQAKTGGNLGEVITNLSILLRQRKSLLLKIKTLSQEAKSSAAILICLPFLVIGALMFIGKGYMDIMFTTTMGNYILIACAIWMSIGVMIMMRMINFYR